MTTYTATCARTGSWWAITVAELPGVFSQARRLDQVEAMARDAIASFLDVVPKSFEVRVEPEVPAEVTVARVARAKMVEAEESAEKATVEAAKTLLSQGYTVRDAGKLLGISPQRVSQLTSTGRAARKTARERSAKSELRGRKNLAA